MILLAAPPSPPSSSSRQPLQKKPVCLFVVIYDDLRAAERAETFCEKLARKLSLNGTCRKEAWSFGLLRQFPNIAQITAEEAAENADYLILSIDGPAELPAHVKAWMERWGARVGDRKHALITLFNKFHERERAAVSTRAYLHRFTNGHRE
jgi:hypothetical protein